ncbi:MAG TPA: hypothetical protein IAB01_05435 [Candidatus Avidesulfovibrio excrementigallinarum]|nr:hypothetical protein [Candidatus Avidesulfovibrio excrementigallinarum]
MKELVFRGILIGCSLGVILALAGFSDSLGRAFLVGGIAGALAGVTIARRRSRGGRPKA